MNLKQKYISHVNPGESVGRGTMPDYPIQESLDDMQHGLDRPLLFAFDLIRKNRPKQ